MYGVFATLFPQFIFPLRSEKKNLDHSDSTVWSAGNVARSHRLTWCGKRQLTTNRNPKMRSQLRSLHHIWVLKSLFREQHLHDRFGQSQVNLKLRRAARSDRTFLMSQQTCCKPETYITSHDSQAHENGCESLYSWFPTTTLQHARITGPGMSWRDSFLLFMSTEKRSESFEKPEISAATFHAVLGKENPVHFTQTVGA